jgi:putative transposase
VALYARGLTVRDIQAPLAEIYDARGVAGSDQQGHRRGAGRRQGVAVPAVGAGVSGDLFLDAITCKVRDHGVVARKAAYLAVGIDADGYKDVLGIRGRPVRRREVLAQDLQASSPTAAWPM